MNLEIYELELSNLFVLALQSGSPLQYNKLNLLSLVDPSDVGELFGFLHLMPSLECLSVNVLGLEKYDYGIGTYTILFSISLGRS